MNTNRNRRVVTTMSLFDSAKEEKGSMEWKSIGDVIRGGRVGAYRVAEVKSVKVPVRPAAPHHQQFFILKFRHAR